MQVQITVRDDQFKDIIEKELKALTQEEVHDLVITMMKQYIIDNPDFCKGIFVQKKHHRYDFSSYDEPTDILRSIIKEIDISDDIEPIKNELVKCIMENCKEIVEKLISNAISEALVNSFKDISSFKNVMYEMICSQLHYN